MMNVLPLEQDVCPRSNIPVGSGARALLSQRSNKRDEDGSHGRADETAHPQVQAIAGEQADQEPPDEGSDETVDEDPAPAGRPHSTVHHDVTDPPRSEADDQDGEQQHVSTSRLGEMARPSL